MKSHYVAGVVFGMTKIGITIIYVDGEHKIKRVLHTNVKNQNAVCR